MMKEIINHCIHYKVSLHFHDYFRFLYIQFIATCPINSQQQKISNLMHISCFWLPYIWCVFLHISTILDMRRRNLSYHEQFYNVGTWIYVCLILCLFPPHYIISKNTHKQSFFVVDLFRWYTYNQFWLILTHHKYIPVGIIISSYLFSSRL